MLALSFYLLEYHGFIWPERDLRAERAQISFRNCGFYGSLFSTLTQEMAEVFLLPEVEPSVWKYVEYCPGQGPAICAG